jgi:hypothetical protein
MGWFAEKRTGEKHTCGGWVVDGVVDGIHLSQAVDLDATETVAGDGAARTGVYSCIFSSFFFF